MAQISKHIKSSNHNIHHYDQMIKIIVNLLSKKFKYKTNSTFQLNRLQKHLLMSIVDTPEKDVSKVDRKLDNRKISISSINSSSTLFSCSIREIYDRVYCAQNQRLLLKSYIPAINKSIFLKKNYENIFSEKLSMNCIPGLRITLM